MRKLSQIMESVWSDIHRRSNGIQVKKEDDINLLDQDGLFDYIQEHYEPLSEYCFDNDHTPLYRANEIDIPYLLPYIASYAFTASLRFEKLGKVLTISKDIKDEAPDVYKLIEDNYTLSDFGHFLFCVYPKTGQNNITNSFFIGFLDFLIDNVKDTDKQELILKRK